MRTRNLILLFLLIDLLLVNLAAISIWFLDKRNETPGFYLPYELIILLNASWFVSYVIFIDDFRSFKSELINVFKLNIQKFVVFMAIVSVFIIEINKPYLVLIFKTNALFFILKLGLSVLLYYYYDIKNQKNLKPMVIIGNNNIGKQLFHHFDKNPVLGFKPIGLLDESLEKNRRNGEKYNVLGTIANFQQVYNHYSFNDVIIALPLSDMEHIKELLLISEKNGINPHIVPNYYGVINRTFKVQTLGKVPLLDIRSVPLAKYPNRFWKRAFDLVFSVVLLFLLSPLLMLIAIAVKLESDDGRILYKPVRLGVNGKPFVLYKFCTMRHCDDAKDGKKSTVLNDPRITRLGGFLRKYNLDELPQLINVINNEMSLIGPRPHRVHLNKVLQQKMNNYMVRHFIKPGITGWAQVNGWRGPTETKLQCMGRTLHDIWYIEHWTFALDLYIIFLTVFGRKTKKNAF